MKEMRSPATSAATPARDPTFVLLSTTAYIAMVAAILFVYLRGVFQLLPFRDLIAGGATILWPRFAPVSPLPTEALVLALTLLFALAVVFRRRLGDLVGLVPAPVRGLALPLPVYLMVSGNFIGSALLALLSVAVFFLRRPLSERLRAMLRPVPRFVWLPLARFWPAALYVALFSRSVGSTLLSVVALWFFHYLDVGVEMGFAPVWDRLRALPARHTAALLAARALVGVSAPFVLSYSLAWFNPLYDRSSSLYGLGTMLACYFIARGPAPRSATQSLASSGPVSSPRPLPGLAVLATALGAGLLLALGMEGVALADDCGGPDDCSRTIWFYIALQNAFSALGVSVLGGLGPTLFPGPTPYPGGLPASPQQIQQLIATQQLQYLNQLLANGDSQVKQQGYYIANYSYLGKAWNYQPYVAGPKVLAGGTPAQCGTMATLGIGLFKNAVESAIPGSKVEEVYVEEKSSYAPRQGWASAGAWKDWFDGFAEVNHTAVRVTLLDGDKYILDLWESVGSGKPPAVWTEKQWLDKWRPLIGAGDFVYHK